jgi:hypothetical protein
VGEGQCECPSFTYGINLKATSKHMSKGNSGKKKTICKRCRRKFYAYPEDYWIFMCWDCHWVTHLLLSLTHSPDEIPAQFDLLREEYEKKEFELITTALEKYQNQASL